VTDVDGARGKNQEVTSKGGELLVVAYVAIDFVHLKILLQMKIINFGVVLTRQLSVYYNATQRTNT